MNGYENTDVYGAMDACAKAGADAGFALVRNEIIRHFPDQDAVSKALVMNTVADLVVDLMRYCDAEGICFTTALRLARSVRSEDRVYNNRDREVTA